MQCGIRFIVIADRIEDKLQTKREFSGRIVPSDFNGLTWIAKFCAAFVDRQWKWNLKVLRKLYWRWWDHGKAVVKYNWENVVYNDPCIIKPIFLVYHLLIYSLTFYKNIIQWSVHVFLHTMDKETIKPRVL